LRIQLVSAITVLMDLVSTSHDKISWGIWKADPFEADDRAGLWSVAPAPGTMYPSSCL